MGQVVRAWTDELVAIAWINIGLIVMSMPLFSIYIVESLQDEVAVVYWIPMSILLKIGATKPCFTLIKVCSLGHLVFMFLLALQLIVEPPTSVLVVCAYGICFVYLLAALWIMKNFMQEMKSDNEGDAAPVMDALNTSSCISGSENFDELNDVADQRFVFRLQPLSKPATSSRSKF